MSESPEIQSRQGDQGTTALGPIRGVPKYSQRVAACGEVEEASLTIDTAIHTDEMSEELDESLQKLRADLANVRTDLSTPLSENATAQVRHEHIDRLDAARNESDVEARTETAQPAIASRAASQLRLAAAVTRRAERTTWALIASEPDETTALPAVYLNHLSALLLVVAERAGREASSKIPLGICGNSSLQSAVGPEHNQ